MDELEDIIARWTINLAKIIIVSIGFYLGYKHLKRRRKKVKKEKLDIWRKAD